MKVPFQNRAEAGRLLAEKLMKYKDRHDVIVLGLPRGGVPVAYEVASRLRLPLDVFIVRKLGLPGFSELAMGAIASGGVRVVNQELVQHIPNARTLLDLVAEVETAEIERREHAYRDGRPALDVRGRTVILVDDGLATGATMRAAAEALRQREIASIIVAVPVGSPQTCRQFEREVDETICALAPRWFAAVGQYYKDFSQTTDDEVRELLTLAAQRSPAPE
ncbi:MAG: phosphoribosyltransferase [Chthoniobacterales bacterium]